MYSTLAKTKGDLSDTGFQDPVPQTNFKQQFILHDIWYIKIRLFIKKVTSEESLLPFYLVYRFLTKTQSKQKTVIQNC